MGLVPASTKARAGCVGTGDADWNGADGLTGARAFPNV